MCADSFITSPKLPVSVSMPLPLIFTASILSTSPPTLVQANPLTMPTIFFLSVGEISNTILSRNCPRFCGVSVIDFSPFKIIVATLRIICAIL